MFNKCGIVVLGFGLGTMPLGGIMKIRQEQLDQYDLVIGDYIEKVASKYAPKIGRFLIQFSTLEHTLDIAINECISDRMHSTGYLILEGLSLERKIELYRKLSQEYIKHVRPHRLDKLKLIIKRLGEARVFRNYLVHANWSTLEQSGYVRIRVVEKDVEIVFKKVRIKPATIDAWIRRIERLSEQLWDFAETQFN